MSLKPLSLTAYGQLAIPLAFAGLPLYVHAPDYYAARGLMTLGSMGTILLCIRAFDAVVDPFIGIYADRFSRYRLYIVAFFAVLFAAAFYALFTPPASGDMTLWFTLSVALATMSFSVLSIQLNAVGSLWSADDRDKTRINTTREALGLLGLMGAVALPQLVGGFTTFALIAASVTLLSAVIFSLWYRATRDSFASSCMTHDVSSPKKIPADIRRFYAVYGLGMLASSMPAVLIMFFVRDYLQLPEKIPLFLGLYFISGIVFMPAFKKLADRFGYRYAWLAAMAIGLLGFSGAAVASPGDMALYALVCVVSGIGFGGELSLPPAYLSSLVDRAGQAAHTARYFGFYAFFMKAALALASALSLWGLDLAGFVPAASTQTANALAVLVFFYAILPCVIKTAAAVLLYKNKGE